MIQQFFVVFTAILISTAFNLTYSQGIVKGKVRDLNTSEPLYGVYIISESGQVATSGPDGSFQLRAGKKNIPNHIQVHRL
jgi:hypothetical protein